MTKRSFSLGPPNALQVTLGVPARRRRPGVRAGSYLRAAPDCEPKETDDVDREFAEQSQSLRQPDQRLGAVVEPSSGISHTARDSLCHAVDVAKEPLVWAPVQSVDTPRRSAG